jgi:hypothetical protein
MQAIDQYFDTKMIDFMHCKLTELDWEILEGLEMVLKVG